MGDSQDAATGLDPREGAGCPCVVLVGRGSVCPDDLLKGLEKRGAQVQVVSDAPGVMVELAAGARAVIISEPHSVRRLPELLAAMRRYYPGSPCWWFTSVGPDGAPSLQKIESRENAPPTAAPPANGASGRKARKPPEKKVKAGESPQKEPLAPPAASVRAPLLTPDELSMLLAPLPEPQEPEFRMERGDAEKQS